MEVKSKTAHKRPEKPFALHVVYDRSRSEWAVIHSSLPLRNGGGQLIRSFEDAESRQDAIDFANKLAKATDEVIVHDDVVIGHYDPKLRTSVYPA